MLYWPVRYSVSRVVFRGRWRRRQRVFRRRPDWHIEDWREALRFSEDEDADCGAVLRSLGEHLAVSWKRLRPDDALNGVLKLPGSRLHELMVSDLFDNLECLVQQRSGLSADSLPEPPFDPWTCSIKELLGQVLRLMSGEFRAGEHHT